MTRPAGLSWLTQIPEPHRSLASPTSFQGLSSPKFRATESEATPQRLHSLAAQNLRLGQGQLQADNPGQAFFHARVALRQARSAGDSQAEAAAHRLLGAILTELGDHDKARHCDQTAEKVLLASQA